MYKYHFQTHTWGCKIYRPLSITNVFMGMLVLLFIKAPQIINQPDEKELILPTRISSFITTVKD